MVSLRTASAISRKQVELRNQLWPNAEPLLWHRTENKGFTTIPKTMPLVLRIMDEMTKGTPVSSTYIALWCSTWDNSMASLAKQRELADAAGFSGPRAEYVWTLRVRKLAELNFIDFKAGRTGTMAHALLYNPHLVIRWHHDNKTPGLAEASFNSLIEWAIELGAKDMTEENSDAMKAFRKVVGVVRLED